MSWGSRLRKLDVARLSIVKAGRQTAAIVHRVVAQGAERARLHGARLAQRVISLQRAAGATPAMVRESAKSVANKALTLPGDRAWQASYVAEAGKHVEGLVPVPEGRHQLTYATGSWDIAPAPPAKPTWPNKDPHGKEAAG